MKRTTQVAAAVAVCLVAGLVGGARLFANGGPFVLKYPNGDPAAKGVLARLDPDLRPGRVTKLSMMFL